MRTARGLIAFVFVFGLTVAVASAGSAADEAENGLELLRRIEDAFVAVADKVMPAVVSVDVTQSPRPSRDAGWRPQPDRSPFSDILPFLGLPDEFYERRPVKGSGSGFIVYSDGYILTNYHVVEDAGTIRVRTADGSQYTAEVHGPDPKTDLALIKIDATDLPTVTLGDSDTLKVGQFVMAIGNPSGFDHTMNVGHVTALGRHGIAPGHPDFSQEDFIQTDAGIGLGMSGGPLVNISGEVVGINTLTAPFARALGFAVPINMASEILPELKEKGRVVRGYLGVLVTPLEYGVGHEYGLPDDKGALVSEVMPGSPADEAGLETYDVIREVNGTKITDGNALVRTVSRIKPGTTVTVVVVRDAQEHRLTATLVEQPANPDEEPAGAGRSPLDVVVRDLTDEDIERYGVRKGVLVTRVTAGGVGDQGGLRPEDVILELDREPITSARQFYRELDRIEPNALVVLRIMRDGRPLIRHVRVPDEE